MDIIRFIPTCVGKLHSANGLITCRAVHPHVCGETGYERLVAIKRLRFIPTCVGKLLYFG